MVVVPALIIVVLLGIACLIPSVAGNVVAFSVLVIFSPAHDLILAAKLQYRFPGDPSFIAIAIIYVLVAALAAFFAWIMRKGSVRRGLYLNLLILAVGLAADYAIAWAVFWPTLRTFAK